MMLQVLHGGLLCGNIRLQLTNLCPGGSKQSFGGKFVGGHHRVVHFLAKVRFQLGNLAL
jgi:hypothetical protein